MTWQFETRSLKPEGAQQVRLLHDGGVATYADVLEGWQADGDFVDAFVERLASAPFAAFYFETPPVSRDTPEQDFEFVLIDSRLLARFRPEPRVFMEHFRSPRARDGIAAFANLGGDAVLVAPCPGDPPGDYAHLAAFARHAPLALQRALWRRVGEAADQWLAGDDPVWISTAGQGVGWLHVRLDRSPKYYNHAPYRKVRRG